MSAEELDPMEEELNMDEDELEAIFADEASDSDVPENDTEEAEENEPGLGRPLKENEIVVPSDEEEQQVEDGAGERSERIVQLPLSRIKALMKADEEINITSAESVISVAKCTELFVKMLVKEMYGQMKGQKRKTLMIRDLEKAIQVREKLAFLEGTLE